MSLMDSLTLLDVYKSLPSKTAPPTSSPVLHLDFGSTWTGTVHTFDFVKLRPTSARTSIYPMGSLTRVNEGNQVCTAIVGEPPSKNNNKRYLLMFGDATVKYVNPESVFGHLGQVEHPIRDSLLPHSYEYFLNTYISSYPNRKMMDVVDDQMLKIRLEGEKSWIWIIVNTVDASMMRAVYMEKQTKVLHYVWLYRGAPRIEGMHIFYNQFAKKSTGESPRPVRFKESCPPKQIITLSKKSNQRKVSVYRRRFTWEDTLAAIGLRYANFSVQYIRLQKDHSPCSTHCRPRIRFVNLVTDDTVSNLTQVRGQINPFHIPLIYRWQRKIREDGSVVYIAPCGKEATDIYGIARILKNSESWIPLNLFVLDAEIDVDVEANYAVLDVQRNVCLLDRNDFKILDDISRGKEDRKIPCFNEMDNRKLTWSSYSTKSMLASKKLLDGIDSAFKCSCDCVNQCRDSDTCQCRRQTRLGVKKRNDLVKLNKHLQTEYGLSNEDYWAMTLENPVITGIYECNSGCQCRRKFCVNSVVETQGVRVKLQLFRDLHKGWGVRVAHDVPAGFFICTYEGIILNENQIAGQSGDSDLECSSSQELETSSSSSSSSDDSQQQKPEQSNGSLTSKISTISDAEAEQLFGFFESDDSCLMMSELPCEIFEQRRESDEYGNDEFLANLDFIETNETANEDMIDILSTQYKSYQRANSSTKTTETPEISKLMDAIQNFSKMKPYRVLLGDPNQYVIDGRNMGNIGRFLNHSCDPNLFVQNVFIESYDMRVPKIAFFTKRAVKAGEELCWDYQYHLLETNNVDEIMLCHCRSQNCRKRLR